MSETTLIKSQLTHHDERIADLSDDLNELKVTVSILAEKHLILIEKLDSFIEKMTRADNRLQKLEEFMITHLERTAFIKSLLKFWPVILATLLFFFSIGVMVDNQKVADEFTSKLYWKKS
ncbi:MAG: hypothetical protein SFW66_07720 [Gammaproteobacteria bacterium]|nr:hypothetical protein [Gammaproteobacteria bacterium]